MVVSAINFGNDFARPGKFDGGGKAKKKMPTAAKVALITTGATAGVATFLGIASYKGWLKAAPAIIQKAGDQIATFGKFVGKKAVEAANFVAEKAKAVFEAVQGKFKKPVEEAVDTMTENLEDLV